MGKYYLRYLVDGFKLPFGARNKKYITVPDKYFMNDVCVVVYKDKEYRVFLKDSLANTEFPDQFGRSAYTLFYFEFSEDQERLF